MANSSKPLIIHSHSAAIKQKDGNILSASTFTSPRFRFRFPPCSDSFASTKRSYGFAASIAITVVLILLSFSATTSHFASAAFVPPTVSGSNSDISGSIRIAAFFADARGSDDTLVRLSKAVSDALVTAVDYTNAVDGGVNGRPVEIVTVSVNVSLSSLSTTRSDFAQVIDSIVGKDSVNKVDYNFSAAFGLLGDLAVIGAREALDAHKLAAFSPIITGTDVPYSPHLIFSRPDTELELLAIVTDLVVRRQLKRIGFAHASGQSYSENLRSKLEVLLGAFHLSISGIFEFPPTAGSNIDSYWPPFADANPQAVIAILPPSTTVNMFLIRCISVFRAQQTPFVVATSYAQMDVLATIVPGYVPSADPVNDPVTIVTSQSAPDSKSAPNDEGLLEFFDKLPYAPASSIYNNLSFYNNSFSASSLVLASFKDALIMLQAIGLAGLNTSRSSVAKATMNNAIFKVAGTPFGIYSTDCSLFTGNPIWSDSTTPMASQHSNCTNNKGSHRVRLIELNTRTGIPALGAYTQMDTSLSTMTVAPELLPRQMVLHVSSIDPTLAVVVSSYSKSLFADIKLPSSASADEATAFTVSQLILKDVFTSQAALTWAASTTANKSSFEVTTIFAHRVMTTFVGGFVDFAIFDGNDTRNNVTALLDSGEDSENALLFLNPQPLQPRLWPAFRRNIITIFPTLQQEFMASAAIMYLISSNPTGEGIIARSPSPISTTMASGMKDGSRFEDISSLPVKLIVSDSIGGWTGIDPGSGNVVSIPYSAANTGALGAAGFENIRSTFEKTLHSNLLKLGESKFFGRDSGSHILTNGSSSPSQLAQWLTSGAPILPDNCHIYLLGLSSLSALGEIDALDYFMTTNPQVTVYLPYRTVEVHYEALYAKIVTPSHRDRIKTASGLPTWNQSAPTVATSSWSDRLATVRTPLELNALITRAALGAVANRVSAKSQLLGGDIVAKLFEIIKINIDATTSIGPYSGESCSSSENLCEINYPTQAMRVLPLSVANGDRSPVGYEAVKVSMTTVLSYTELPAQLATNDSSSLNVVGLVVGVAGGFLVLAICLGLFLYCCYLANPIHHGSGDRDLKNAPTDASKPFTIMFTDIQRSTSLWAEIPELMGEAIDAHHSIIRELIKKHKGYEVKTIGDAFMIAFNSAQDAVYLAKELQERFFTYDFDGVVQIDRCLREFEMQMIAEQDEDADVTAYAALSCYLNEDQYNKSWRGVRVRVGLHTAHGEIKLDPVTHAYDYYGTISNVAARVEAAAYGGQVVCTDATRKAYEDALLGIEAKPKKDSRGEKDGLNGSGSYGSAEIKVHIPAQGALPSRFADDFDDDDGIAIASPVTKVPAIAVTNAAGGSADASKSSNVVAGSDAAVGTTANPVNTNAILFTDLGYNVLRGVPDPMWLLQIETVPGRKFGPLRVEVPPVNQEESEADDASSSQAESLSKQIAKELQRLTDLTVSILRTTFSPVPAKKRVTDFKALCKTWRVKGKTIENFKKKALQEQTEDEEKFLRGAPRNAGGAATTPINANEESGIAASASSNIHVINLLNNNNAPKAPSVNSNNQQRFKNFGGVSNAGTVKTFNINAKTKIIEEEAFIQGVAPLIAAVAIKKLPRSQLMFLQEGGTPGLNGNASDALSMRTKRNGNNSPKQQSAFDYVANSSFGHNAKGSDGFRQVNASIALDDPTAHFSQNYQNHFNSIFTNESTSILPGSLPGALAALGDEPLDLTKIHNLKANYRAASLSNNKVLLGGGSTSSPLLPIPTQSSHGLQDQFSSADELERVSAGIRGSNSAIGNLSAYGGPLTMPKGLYTHMEFLKKETDQWNSLATAAASYPDKKTPAEVIERKKALTTNKFKDERQKLLEAHGLVSGYSHLPPPSSEEDALKKLQLMMATQYPEWYNRDGNHGKDAPPPVDPTPAFVSNIERVLRETIGTQGFAAALENTLSPTSALRAAFPAATLAAEAKSSGAKPSPSTTPGASPQLAAALTTKTSLPTFSKEANHGTVAANYNNNSINKVPSVTATYMTGTGSIIDSAVNTARALASGLPPPTPKDERTKLVQEHGMVSGYSHLPPPTASDEEAKERLKALMAAQFPTLYSNTKKATPALAVGDSSDNGPTLAVASTSGVLLNSHQHPTQHQQPAIVAPSAAPGPQATHQPITKSPAFLGGMNTPLQGSSASEMVALNISPVPHAAHTPSLPPKKKPIAAFDHGIMDNMVLPPPTTSEEEAAQLLKAMFYGNANATNGTLPHAPYGMTNTSTLNGTPSSARTTNSSGDDAIRSAMMAESHSRGPGFGRKSTMAPNDQHPPADPSLGHSGGGIVFAKFKNSINSDRAPASGTPDFLLADYKLVSPGGPAAPLTPISTTVLSSSSVADANHPPVSVLALSSTLGPAHSTVLASSDQFGATLTGSTLKIPKGPERSGLLHKDGTTPPIPPHRTTSGFNVINTATNAGGGAQGGTGSAVSSPTTVTVSAKFPSAEHVAAPGGHLPNGKFNRVASVDTLAPSKAGAITRAPSEMSQVGPVPLTLNTSDSLSSKEPGSHDGTTTIVQAT